MNLIDAYQKNQQLTGRYNPATTTHTVTLTPAQAWLAWHGLQYRIEQGGAAVADYQQAARELETSIAVGTTSVTVSRDLVILCWEAIALQHLAMDAWFADVCATLAPATRLEE